MKLLILNGPNLNLLGVRNTKLYENETLEEINTHLSAVAETMGISLLFAQSNREGELIDCLQATRGVCAGVVFNPGAYALTSYALRDTIASLEIPVVEVLTPLFAREDLGRQSVLSPVCLGTISGFGADGYDLALTALAFRLNQSIPKLDEPKES